MDGAGSLSPPSAIPQSSLLPRSVFCTRIVTAKVCQQDRQPVLVGLDQFRERTEEEFAEVLEEKLPNLPVAFIKVHLPTKH